MNKCLNVFLILFITVMFFAPVNTLALAINSSENVSYSLKNTQTKKNNSDVSDLTKNHNKNQNCSSLLGNPADSNSVAWLVQKVLNYIQVLGPILVVLLSSVDFMKVIMKSDDDAMAKAQKKLFVRLALAASLFFIPIIVTVLLNTFGITSDPTCGLK